MSRTDDTSLLDKPRLMALAVSLIAFLLYLRTLHPGVGPSLDSMELQIAVLTNGVIHPPGSPQYLLLGKLAMSILPGASLAFRLNLFSAICAALTIGVVSLLTYRLTNNTIISAYASLSLAVAVRFWYQSSIAELYTLNGLYVALTLYLLLAWHQEKETRYYWAAAIVYALGFGNHVSLILLLPVFVFVVWITDRTILMNPRMMIITLLIVTVGAMQYALIPIRVSAAPAFCNFCPAPSDLPSYFTGGPFKSAFFDLPRREVITSRLPESIGQWNLQFMPWGYGLGIIGGWELLKRQPKIAIIILMGLLAEYIFVIGYAIPDWHDFLTPVYVLFTPLIGYGVLILWGWTSEHIEGISQKEAVTRILPILLTGLAAVTLVILAFANLPLVDQSDETAYQINGRALLAEANPGAWLLAPPPNSTAFYYSWAVRYLAFADNPELDFSVVMPAEVSPAPGPAPGYLNYVDVASELTPDALIVSGRQVFVLDSSDSRLTSYGLLPICTSDQMSIAGYEVVAVQEGDEFIPLIDSDRWEMVSVYVIRFGEEASCPE